MNAPLFDIANIKSPCGSAAWMREMSEEETRCCGAIVARIDKLKKEESALLQEVIALEKQLEECGLFARLKLTLKMGHIEKEREWRRLALIELSEAHIRIKDTMIQAMDFQISKAEIERLH